MAKAIKVLKFKYGGIEGYDLDQELGIIAATIEEQRQWDIIAKAEGSLAIFKGLNLKRFLIGSWPKVGTKPLPMHSQAITDVSGPSAIRRVVHLL